MRRHQSCFAKSLFGISNFATRLVKTVRERFHLVAVTILPGGANRCADCWEEVPARGLYLGYYFPRNLAKIRKNSGGRFLSHVGGEKPFKVRPNWVIARHFYIAAEVSPGSVVVLQCAV